MKMLEKRHCNCLRATASSGGPWLPAFALVALVALAVVIAIIAVPQRAAAYDACIDDNRCTHEEMVARAYDVFSWTGGTLIPNDVNVKNGAGDEDVHDHIYGWHEALVLEESGVTLTHFWDADGGPDAGTYLGVFNALNELVNHGLAFPNSWNKVEQYWRRALGEYARGWPSGAYEYLGHIAHQIGDHTIPTHAHVSAHDPASGDDSFEDWMSQGTNATDFCTEAPPGNTDLGLNDLWPLYLPVGQYVPPAGGHDPMEAIDLNFDIPEMENETPLDKLYWLLYTTSQIAAFFPSDRVDGDIPFIDDPDEGWVKNPDDDPLEWVQTELTAMFQNISSPRTQVDLKDNDCTDDLADCNDSNLLLREIYDCDNNVDGDFGVIREYSYVRGIRAIAALFKLFEQTVTTQPILSVVITKVEQKSPCSMWPVSETCDFYAQGAFKEFHDYPYLVNKGQYAPDSMIVVPGWSWGRVVPRSGIIEYTLGIRDDDNAFFGDDIVVISKKDNPYAASSIKIRVDMERCLSGAANAVTGEGFNDGRCGQLLTTDADGSETEIFHGGVAKVTFKVVVAVNNNPPVADAGADRTVNEGHLVYHNGSFTDEGDEDPNTHTFLWHLDHATNGQVVEDASDRVFGFFPFDNGTYTFTFTVTDSMGAVDTDRLVVTVDNVAPSFHDVSGQTINENGTAQVSGRILEYGRLDTLEVEIYWGDGSSSSADVDNDRDGAYATFSGTHTYLDDPTGSSDDYTVSLRVTDNDGGVGTASTTNTVNNVAPVITASGQTINENGTAQVSGTIVDPGTQDAFQVRIHWGPGEGNNIYTYAAGTTSYSESHQYLDDNPTGTPSDVYTIDVEIIDDDGGTGAAQTTNTVNNVAPVVTASGQTINENGTAQVSGTIVDPGTQDTFDVEINWGDGSSNVFPYSAGSTTFSETHQYLDDNPTGTPSDIYNVSVTVTDDDGGTGAAQTTNTVNNVNPVVTASGQTINENGTAQVSGTIVDPGTQDTFDVEINWGDGSSNVFPYSAGSTTFSETHQYLDDNPTGTSSDIYNVSVTVTDDDGGVSNTAEPTVTVNNVNPEVSIDSFTDELDNLVGINVPAVFAGLTFDLAGSFTDVGSLDTHTALIEWGEANQDDLGTTTSPIPVTAHIYAYPANYLIELTITDDDTGATTVDEPILVIDAAGAIEIVVDDLNTLLGDPSLTPEAAAHIGSALDSIIGNNGGLAANGALDKLEQGALVPALLQFDRAIESLSEAEAADAGLDFTAEKSFLALAAKSVAVGAINEARALVTSNSDLRKIEQAEALLAEGDELLQAGDFAGAIEKQIEAVRRLQGILAR